MDAAVATIWKYQQMNHHPLVPSDIIFVLGSHDLRVADRASELYHLGLAPLIVMSGGYGNFTKNIFTEPEADLLAARAMELRVPKEAIIVENQSTNCGENISFTRRILDDLGFQVNRVIAIQKPYMERRTYATIRKQWSEVELQVTSPQFESLDSYVGDTQKDDIIHNMMGDLHRIKYYPVLGYQIEQLIPLEVTDAFSLLVLGGYTNHLLKDKPYSIH